MTPAALRYASACSGIEAATVAWGPLGWIPEWFAEIDPFPCAVLAHHYPEVPNLGDITAIDATPGSIDVLVGGTPCQSFSVAGLRGGMADDRGNLALGFLRLVGRARPLWVVWENVPGVHSSWTDETTDPASEGSRRAIEEARRVAIEAGLDLGAAFGPGDFEEADQTNDFACFLNGLSELGYGWAYRILDAQFFGVPQRRRRVFVVGYLGDWRPAAAVLLERHGLSGDPPPSRQAKPDLAGSVTPGARRASGNRGSEPLTVSTVTTNPWADGDCDDGKLVAGTLDCGVGERRGAGQNPGTLIAHALTGSNQRLDGPVETLIADTLKGHRPRGREDDTYIPDVGFGLTSSTGRNDNGSRVGNAWNTNYVAHTLRADGFDASEDGTGRGMPLVPVPFNWREDDTSVKDQSPCLGQRDDIAIAYQCHGSNVGEMGTIRAGNGNTAGGVPFIVNAAESCAKASHARESETARCLDGTGGFATNQGGTVVVNTASNNPASVANTLEKGGIGHVDAKETRPREVLRALRNEVGEEAFQEWCLGVIASLLPPQVLRSLVHGGRFRCPTDDCDAFMGDGSSPREEDRCAGGMRAVWRAGRDRRASPQWRLDGQLAGELGAYLSELPQQGAQIGEILHDLREASEGIGVLRQTLSEVQEIWGSADRPKEPTHGAYGVRRLTPREAERLQGFPDGYTLVPYNGGMAADGPRYKAIGNSMAVPVMRWIGERISVVHSLVRANFPDECAPARPVRRKRAAGVAS